MSTLTKVMSVSFITNFALSLLKIVIGWIGKSGALVADGIHSFSDLTTDIVAIVGNRLARKPADLKHPYGHGKSEYVTSMIIGSVVLLLGLGIISSSTNRTIVIPSLIVIIVSLFTIVAKFLLAYYLIHCGKKYQNTILIASGKESSADVISSIVVLVSSILMQFSSTISILKYADILASIIVGIFVVHTGFEILKENISIILGEQETNQTYRQSFIDFILKEPEIKSVDHFYLLKYGPYYTLDMEISMDGRMTLEDAHQLAHKMERSIQKKDERISKINIHINAWNENDSDSKSKELEK